MMGYFDALLRSGGLLGTRSLGGPVAPAEADPLTYESAQFDRTSMPADIPAPSRATPAETSTAALEPAPRAAEQAAARADVTRPPGPSNPLRDATAIPHARVPDQPPEQGAEAIGRTRVQAALRWVAAAPTQAQAEGRPFGEHAGAPSGNQSGGELEAFAVDAHSTGRRAALAGGVVASSPLQPHDTSLSAPRILRSEPAHSGRVERAVGQAAEMAAPAHRPGASRAREETVEVSIGAIHVRVDAPQTRAGTRSAMPKATPPLPEADRARSESTSHNSRLARRGLRRI